MGRACAPILALIAAVACGPGASASYEQSHSAQQIVNDASSSTGSATSFHITVNATTQDGPATADFDVAGSNVQGMVNGQGMTIHLIHVNGQTFVNGTDLADILTKTNPQAAAIVKAKASDKWVLMPSAFWSSTTIADAVDMQKLTSCLKAAAGLKKKGSSTISGQNVVEVDDRLTDRMYVQTGASHYFMRIALAGGDTCLTDSATSSETIDLTKVGQKVDITAPAGSVDLQTIAGP